jgi:alpha-1,2-mannosyltransferase
MTVAADSQLAGAAERSAPSLRRPTRLPVAWSSLLLATVGLVCFLVLWVVVPLRLVRCDPSLCDFHINFLGAGAVRAGLDPYEQRSLWQVAAALGVRGPAGDYTNPPVHALVLVPLIRFGEYRAYAAYYAINLLALVAAIGIGMSLAGGRRPWRWAVGYTCAWPAITSLVIGQADGVIALALSASCWGLLRRGRVAPVLAGAPIGLVAGLKLLPGIFMVYFLLTRRWGALAWAAAGFLVTMLAPVIWLGWGAVAEFVGHLSYFGNVMALAENVSLTGVLARLLVGPDGLYQVALGPLPPVALATAASVSVAVVAWSLRQARAQPPVAAYLTLVAASLLAAPIAWDDYLAWCLPFLLLPLATLGRRATWRSWLLGAGVLLLFLPVNPLYWAGLIPLEAVVIPLRQAGLIAVLAATAGRATT